MNNKITMPIDEYLLWNYLITCQMDRMPSTWAARSLAEIKKGNADLAGAWARNAAHLAIKQLNIIESDY